MDGKSMVPILQKRCETVLYFPSSVDFPRQIQIQGRSTIVGKLNTRAGLCLCRTAPRNDFLIEYTGLSAWPHGPKPWDSHSKASKRVNDSPNNTFRGLRIFAGNFGLGTSDLAFVQYTTSEDWNYETPYHHEL